MARVTVNETYLSDIADAIRSKNGTENTYTPAEMADAIEAISGGGITPTGTKEITSNGTGIDVASYAYADVAVPNSYSAGDEGKVVSNGALVSQTSDTVTSNNTYDTTLINSLTVNVSGGITPTGTKQISITQNGTTTEDVTNYASAEISVNVTPSTPDYTTILTRTKSGAFSDDNLTSIGRAALYYCTSITSLHLSRVTSIATDGARNMTAMTVCVLPSCTSFAQQCLSANNKMATCDILGNSSAGLSGSQVFSGCSVLKTLIIRSAAICKLSNINTFNSTPFANGGSGGTIYIPKTLYDALGTGTNDYKAASNWSTLDGYGTITWAKIEGSIYETQYADGTPIPS